MPARAAFRMALGRDAAFRAGRRARGRTEGFLITQTIPAAFCDAREVRGITYYLPKTDLLRYFFGK